MDEVNKKYIKTYCSKTKTYGLVTVGENNGVLQVINFYEIDEDTAKSIVTSHDGPLPAVSSYLKPCASCGGRIPRCCDKKKQCRVGQRELWYQCLYCSNLEISEEKTESAAEFFFLMDNSGSMSFNDRGEAAKAVNRMIQSLQGKGNTYSFVAWGSDAGYVFYKQTNLTKIGAALLLYRSGRCGHSGSTAADLALRYIQKDVVYSKKPVRIILVTDGYFDDLPAAIAARNELLVKQNVEIVAIGVTGADQGTLSSIGTVPEFSKVIGDSTGLTSTFEQIAEILKKKGNNF